MSGQYADFTNGETLAQVQEIAKDKSVQRIFLLGRLVYARNPGDIRGVNLVEIDGVYEVI